jgi:hypothetical protein
MKSLKLRMTLRIIAIAMGVSLAVSVARGETMLIHELDEGINVSYKGVPLDVTITFGDRGEFLIQLPLDFTIDNFSPLGVIIGEPENPFPNTAFNFITVSPGNIPTIISWESDILNTEGTPPSPLFQTVFDAGRDPMGNRFDLRLADTVTPLPGLPDSGTTAMLLGSALGGLGLIRRFVRR